MIHNMKLKDEPFLQILSGKKTIEMRLFDEKRQALQIGDQIEFSRESVPEQKLLTHITALHRFDSFAQLYHTLPLEQCGYEKEQLSTASPQDMEKYYSQEKQKKYGVVGIEFVLLDR